MCKQDHDRLPTLASVCTDDGDVLAVTVSRFIAAAHVSGDGACWTAAYDGAERLLGPIKGAMFVAGMTALVRALRLERSADWRFMPPTCCRMTGDEQELLATLAVARGRHHDAAKLQEAAARLAARPQAPLTAAAARAAAALLDDARLSLLTRSGAPAQPIVVH